MLLTIILFLSGFILLIAGSNFLVNGAVALGHRYSIPSIVVGMVIVGFGTSLPELIISVVATIKNAPDISISNAVGSNIANILIIIGLLGIVGNIEADKHTIHRKLPFVIFSSIVLYIATHDTLLFSSEKNVITVIDGIVFIIFFGSFLIYSFFFYKSDSVVESKPKIKRRRYIFAMLISGLIGVYYGGDWVVENAIIIAKHFGMTEAFIGVSILAVGSSLPEIFSSITAILKKQSDIAVGNIIGSNIFNTFLILSVASFIRPLPVSLAQQYNIWINIFASVLFLVLLKTGKKSGSISMLQGMLLLGIYFFFIIFCYYN